MQFVQRVEGDASRAQDLDPLPMIGISVHAVLPRSARRVRDGQPAALTRPSDYPITTVCMVCRQAIRCERFYLAEWRHVETEPGSD
jgi:hypothetical protein